MSSRINVTYGLALRPWRPSRSGVAEPGDVAVGVLARPRNLSLCHAEISLNSNNFIEVFEIDVS
ncbi:hypothetical protein WMF38_44240 [Sorangium sp. So ce118]